MGKLHISIDDTKWVFRDLKDEKPKSLFDLPTFKFLLNLHEKYGSTFIFYCTYMGNTFRLTETPDIYREQFTENDWLKFGFHTYDQRKDYQNRNELNMGKHYVDVTSEIRRITGRAEYNDFVRIHKFQGNKQACADLKKLGVSALLTADDDRQSYFLSCAAEKQLHKDGHFTDPEIDLEFYRSLPRIETTLDILEIVKEKEEAGWEVLSVFTHERFLGEENVMQRLEKLCAWGMGRH